MPEMEKTTISIRKIDKPRIDRLRDKSWNVSRPEPDWSVIDRALKALEEDGDG